MARFELLNTLSILSPRMVLRAALYSRTAARRLIHATQPTLRGRVFRQAVKEELSKPARPELPPHGQHSFGGRILDTTSSATSITSQTALHSLRVEVLTDNLLLIRVRQDHDFPEPFSYSVTRSPHSVPPTVEQAIDLSDTTITLQTDCFSLQIDKSNGFMNLLSQDGRIVFQGRGVGHHSESGQTSWQAQFDPASVFYGLGEKAGQLNHAGQKFELWNTDPAAYDRGDDPIYMSIPFITAQHNGLATGLFFDNTYRAFMDVGATEEGVLHYQVVNGEFRLYLMHGTPREVLSAYTELTGRMPMPPLWALGFHQSRWSYFPQSRVLEIAHEFRKRNLPCDVIHLDIHYMDDYRCFTWDKSRFPEPDGMINSLHSMGFKALSMIDPGIKVDPGYHVYDQGIEGNHFITYPDGVPFTGPVWPGNCHFPDFTNPNTRQWWGGLYQPLLESGIDAFWNDMNEIALITQNSRSTWVPDIVEHSKEGDGATHDEIHNVYGMLMARATSDGLLRLQPDRRPLVLTRSGWAGVQRHAMHWTGDNKSTWDHLRLSIQMVLNLGLSGIAFTGPDIGGFTGGPSPELFARWIQLGAVTPFMRSHSMINSPDHEPWAFGPEVEAISRQYLELRYRLLPYLYTAVWQAHVSGSPIMRPMSFDWPADTITRSLDDQFMLGDALLAAPVVEEGAVQRNVYLPDGTWYDFWTGQLTSVKATIRCVDAPLHHMPIFVRGGSVIPFWPVQQYIGEKSIDTLELQVYDAAGEHRSILYEDDGQNPDYDNINTHRVTQFSVKSNEQQLSISRIPDPNGYRPSYKRVNWKIYGLVTQPSAVQFDRGELISHTWDSEARQLSLTTTATKARHLLIHK